MYPLLGLNLLFLLSQNRVAEFHIELELLPVDKILNNVYIKHPVSLEQYIMEGSYNKVRSRFPQRTRILPIVFNVDSSVCRFTQPPILFRIQRTPFSWKV